ncbi:MAG: hypothetical protein M3Q06_02740, partial [Bacteroidota bacterium]|nr:hypothetical protein [Bacteroidota bacterium]
VLTTGSTLKAIHFFECFFMQEGQLPENSILVGTGKKAPELFLLFLALFLPVMERIGLHSCKERKSSVNMG